jgi:hypothetical protein
MIYSPAFTGLPTPLRQRILRDVDSALRDANTPSHLADPERHAVRQILAETLPEFTEVMP